MIDIPMNASGPVSMSLSAVPQQSQAVPAPIQSTSQQVRPIKRQRNLGGVSLRKGQKVNLDSGNGQPLRTLKIGLYWDCIGQIIDLDSECFMLGADGKVVGDDWFVFYNQTISPDGSIQHSGDSKDGSAAGDDEVITADLQRLNPSVKKLVFVITINDEEGCGHNFSMLSEAGVHIQNAETGVDLCNFKLTNMANNVISIVIGEVYNHNGQWKFNPIGEGANEDLYGLCNRYGVQVSD